MAKTKMAASANFPRCSKVENKSVINSIENSLTNPDNLDSPKVPNSQHPEFHESFNASQKNSQKQNPTNFTTNVNWQRFCQNVSCIVLHSRKLASRNTFRNRNKKSRISEKKKCTHLSSDLASSLSSDLECDCDNYPLKKNPSKTKKITMDKNSISCCSDLPSTCKCESLLTQDASDILSSECAVSFDQDCSSIETPASNATEWDQLSYNVEEDSSRIDPSSPSSDFTELNTHPSISESHYTYISNSNIGAVTFQSHNNVNLRGAKIAKLVVNEPLSKSHCEPTLNEDKLLELVKPCFHHKYVDRIGTSIYLTGNLPNMYISLELEDPECQTQHYIWKSKHRNSLSNLFTRQNNNNFLDDLSSVFNFEKRQRYTRIIIEGQPGYGKSILTKMMAFDWITGSKLQEFSLLFLIELKKCNDGDIMDIVFQQLINSVDVKDSHKFALKEFVSKNAKKILFVLDGFDELNESPCKENIMKLISGEIFTASTVILTSRPFKLQEFTSTERGKTFRLVGFQCRKSRKSFIKKFFKSVKSKKLGKQVKHTLLSNEKIENLTKCPLFLTLLCTIYKEDPDIFLDPNLHTTLTGIYLKIFKTLVQFYMIKNNRSISDGNFIFPPEIEDDFLKFGRVCLTSLMNEKVMFRESNFTNLNNSLILDLGFLFRDKHTLPGEVVYYPKHQTFLEFLAAYYLSKLDSAEMQHEVAILYQNSQNDLKNLPCGVFYFLTGLIKENKEKNLADLLRGFPTELFAAKQLAQQFLENIFQEWGLEQITDELKEIIEAKAPNIKLFFGASGDARAYLELLDIL